MKLKWFKFFIISGLFLLTGPGIELSAQDQPTEQLPKIINFSGVITADDLLVPDGEYSILFSLYENLSGGEPLWSELHEKVQVVNGELDVQLGGASVPNPLNLTFNKQYYLGIKLNNTEELTPRISLVPVPYSVRTLTANTVQNNSITSEKIAPRSVTNEKIKSVSWSKITDVPELARRTMPVQSGNKSVLPDYWRRYGNYLDSGEEFLGTINDRNLVIKTDSIQRMLFDPYGKVVAGTITDSVFFEVIGFTTLGNVWVKIKMGVGADFDETDATVHIKSVGTEIPFRVDNDGEEAFVIESNGRVEITSRQSGADDTEENYPLFLNAEDQGIAIKINSNTSNADNNYMGFWDDDGIAGRIEGQDVFEYLADPRNIVHDVWFIAQGAALIVAIAASATGELEVPDMINGAAEVIYWAFQTEWDLFHTGVSYESGNGDYAEWLQKLNPNELFTPGEIVGVRGGKISGNTNNAEQLMTVSAAPLILGNMPPQGKEADYEKIAFKGQVPVKVRGIVHNGDYIIPSGLNDGIGIAVEPEMMTIQEFTKVVGRAWESNSSYEVKLINVAVGMRMKDLVNCVKKQSDRRQKLENLLVQRNKELDSILSELKEAEESVRLAKALLEHDNTSVKPVYTSNKK